MSDNYRRKPRAILVDAMHLCYRHYHVMKAREDSFKGDLFVGFYQGVFKSIRFMRKNYPRHDIYFLWDSENRRRSTMMPEYKKRSKSKKEIEASKNTRVKLYDQLPELKTMLTLDGIHQISADGYEADDVARYMVERLCADDNKEILLWTGDLDWAQLIMDRVKWINAGKRNLIYDSRAFKKQYGFPPEGIRVYKALTGDKSDNIKGIHMFPKLLAKTLAGRTTTVEGFFYDRAILNDIPEKWKIAIKESAGDLRLRYQLVSLMKIERPDIVIGAKDKEVLASYCNKYGIGAENRSKADAFYLKKKREKNEQGGEEEKKTTKSILQGW